MAKKRPKIPYYMRPLTEAQLRAETNRRVEGILGPQRSQIQSEAASRAATIQAASKAASELLASHAGLTQEGYHTATQDVAGFGAGYTDQMKQRIQASRDAAAAFSASQGQDGPTTGADLGALSDTVLHGGVTIPGSALASQGAAATALDSEQAGIPLLQGAQDIRASMQDEEKALLELAQKRPDLRSQIMDELYKREQQKLQARIQQQAQDLYASQFSETQRSHLANEALSNDRNRLSKMRYDEQVRVHDAAINKAANEGRDPNASLSKAYGYIVDAKGHPILDKNGNKIPVAKSGGAAGQKAKSNAQYQKAVGEAGNMFEDSKGSTDPSTGLPVPPRRKWKWGNAMNYLMNRYGIQRSRARQALIAAGFRPPASSRGPDGTGPR